MHLLHGVVFRQREGYTLKILSEGTGSEPKLN
jgi:hypothetical protein